jgi:hypothetical protein
MSGGEGLHPINEDPRPIPDRGLQHRKCDKLFFSRLSLVSYFVNTG